MARDASPITEPDAEASVLVDAPPDAVWAIVSDPTRIPEWSPVCHTVERVGEGRYRGHSKLNGVRWSREFAVSESEPGKAFGFSTFGNDGEQTRWRYSLAPEDGGTRVTEGYQIVSIPRWLRVLRKLPGMVAKSERDTRWNLETSLQRLKGVVEAD